VDVFTGTLGKALGGSSGGYTSGRKPIIDILRQKSRTYLFSNTLSPIIASGSLKVLELIKKSPELKMQLDDNTDYFRAGIKNIGLEIKEGVHPIVPVMCYDERKAAQMAEKLLTYGVYAIGFFFPVVARGQARVRCQVSAAHTRAQLDTAIAAFAKINEEMS